MLGIDGAEGEAGLQYGAVGIDASELDPDVDRTRSGGGSRPPGLRRYRHLGPVTMSGRVGVRLALVILATIALQFSLLNGIRIGHVHPEIIWLIPAAAGLLAGPELGIVIGFLAGLWLDCLVPTPFGLSALVGASIGYLAGLLEQRGVVVGAGQVVWVGPGLGAAAGLFGVLLFGVIGWLMGDNGFASVDYLVLTILELVVAGSLMMPVLWGVRWALGTEGRARRPRRRQAAW